jgi:hypothetical protein
MSASKKCHPCTGHSRTIAFVEHVVVHRLFLLGLLCGYLALLGGVVVRLGEPKWVALAAGVLSIAAKNSCYHFVWITDGFHVLQAIFFAVAVHLLLRHLDGSRWSGAWAIVCAVFAPATREDSLVIFSVMLLIGFYYVNRDGGFRVPSRLLVFAAALVGIVVLFCIWRGVALRGAAQFKLDERALDGVWRMVFWTVSLPGQERSYRWGSVIVGTFVIMGV